jgi:hypothetical protein
VLPTNLWGDFSLDFAVLIHAGKGIYLFEGQINHIRDFVQEQIQENLAVKIADYAL